MRSALITMAFVACAVPAFAQTADPDDKRFTLYKVAEGFLRLDGRTGVREVGHVHRTAVR